MCQLTKLLASNCALTILVLLGNEIGVQSNTALAELLKVNIALRQVDLILIAIQDVGAIELARGLGSNNTLTSLNLHCNTIKSQGRLAIINALALQHAQTKSRCVSFNLTPKYGHGLRLTRVTKCLGLAISTLKQLWSEKVECTRGGCKNR